MKSEHQIQNEIRVVLSQNKCTVFRANVGSVKLPDGRWFTTGLPKGFPDLFGIRWSDNQTFFIEVKNATGKPRADQVRFHEFLKSHNVIHGIARSSEDALKIVQCGLVGYGYQEK
ncbi:VRR-NUC domain-containing protein [Lactobacillus sp. PSON]|uniref:VRR-NUC domain-containing protein n=1 Tax=Lactobacillus sp. PSON TaxID=3455454 RepID=UPI004040F17D